MTLTNFVLVLFVLDEFKIWLVNPMTVSLESLGVAVFLVNFVMVVIGGGYTKFVRVYGCT